MWGDYDSAVVNYHNDRLSPKNQLLWPTFLSYLCKLLSFFLVFPCLSAFVCFGKISWTWTDGTTPFSESALSRMHTCQLSTVVLNLLIDWRKKTSSHRKGWNSYQGVERETKMALFIYLLLAQDKHLCSEIGEALLANPDYWRCYKTIQRSESESQLVLLHLSSANGIRQVFQLFFHSPHCLWHCSDIVITITVNYRFFLVFGRSLFSDSALCESCSPEFCYNKLKAGCEAKIGTGNCSKKTTKKGFPNKKAANLLLEFLLALVAFLLLLHHGRGVLWASTIFC